MIKKIVMIMMLILNIISFSEVPHTYIYDNPEKAITTAEILKKKPNGAEMNISVTKVKTQEIEGLFNKEDKKIYLTINELNMSDRIVITDTLKDIKNPSKLMLSKSKYDYEYNYPDIDVSTEGMALNSKLYIIVLDSTNNLKFIKKVSSVKEYKPELYSVVDKVMKMSARSNEVIFEFRREYLWNANQLITGEHISELTKEVEIGFGATNNTHGSHRGNNRTAYGRTFVDVIDANGTLIETKTFTWWTYLGGDNTHNANVPYRVYYTNKFNRPVIVKLRWSLDLGGYTAHINGGRADISVVKSVNQVFKYIVSPLEGTTNLSFNDNYQKSYANFSSTSYADSNALVLENSVPGMTFSTSGAGIITMENGDVLDINGVQTTVGASGNLGERVVNIGNLGLKYKVEGGKLRLGLNSWGVVEPLRTATIKVFRGAREVTNHVFNIQAPKRLEGSSRITLKEYYPIDTYIAFNSVNLNSPVPLALENSIRDVLLESSNQHGLATMQQGDILEINGVQSQIGTSGNLVEKAQNIDSLAFKYKVEGGKLRLALTGWGVLEPRRDITIRIIRGANEISKHVMNIKSPTKVEGDTSLKFDNTYQIRSFAKFKGINLSMPEFLVLERHQGVNLEGTNGAGIPYMNQGDKIYISDNFTVRRSRRAVFADNYYEIGASGTLAKQNIKLTNGEVGVQVEGGKLNLALNNWTVNKNVNVRVQIVRGTNQIMDHTFTLKAPDAPFNVISQGVLDFGTIIAGAKNRTAETDVKIEMIKDVTDIKFKLNTDSPELYNKNGTTLRARNLQALVRQQANRRYLVKIQGKLDVPENQELGEYSGSLVLEMKIK
ncbi:MAG: hypothetical protein ACRC8M_10550 [Cetobacterium sp.]|uniref:hypothetical protein n=1 Tax=Cetobacterium sp. TaxID=2071632 RepID=UPI003F341A23